jgi:hypothetical protein
LAVCIAGLSFGIAAIAAVAVRHAIGPEFGFATFLACCTGIVAYWSGLFVGTGVGSHTVRCRECGGYTTSSAGTCPACGRLLPGHLIFKGALVVVAAVSLWAAVLLATPVLRCGFGLLADIAEHDARLGHRLAVQEEERKAKEAGKTESGEAPRHDPASYPTDPDDDGE